MGGKFARETASRVPFGESSSLKVIGILAFGFCGAREIRILDAIEELCFFGSKSLPLGLVVSCRH